MWKILAGFILFAALGMFVILKGGDKVSLAGEAEEQKEAAPLVSPAQTPADAAKPAADAQANPAANPASAPAPAASAEKMSTTGTIVVGTPPAVAK